MRRSFLLLFARTSFDTNQVQLLDRHCEEVGPNLHKEEKHLDIQDNELTETKKVKKTDEI